MVLALIAAKTVKDRDGSKLGAYFAVVPGIWAMEILLLLVIAAYVAGLLILTSQRVRLTRWILPIGIGFGAATAGVLYALAPFGVNVDPNGPSAEVVGAGRTGAAPGDRVPGGAIVRPGHATGRPWTRPGRAAWPRAAPRRRLPCCWLCSPRSRSRCSRTTCRSKSPRHRLAAGAKPATRTRS